MKKETEYVRRLEEENRVLRALNGLPVADAVRPMSVLRCEKCDVPLHTSDTRIVKIHGQEVRARTKRCHKCDYRVRTVETCKNAFMTAFGILGSKHGETEES